MDGSRNGCFVQGIVSVLAPTLEFADFYHPLFSEYHTIYDNLLNGNATLANMIRDNV